MDKIFNCVPNILTKKDLNYINDLFNYNYISFKNTNNIIPNTDDDEIKNIELKSRKLFKLNMDELINILERGINNDNN